MRQYHTYMLVFINLFLFIFSVDAQVARTGSGTAPADSNQSEAIEELSLQLRYLQSQTERNQRLVVGKMDSLNQVLEAKQHDYILLKNHVDSLETLLMASCDSISNTAALVVETREKGRRSILLVSAIFLTLLILLVLYFLLTIKRLYAQTEQKISALRKYTVTEIEDARAGFKDWLTKSVKKMKKKVLTESAKLPKAKSNTQVEKVAFKEVKKRLKALENLNQEQKDQK